jgi:DNA (cytosine-5)-methyltransferase 1
MSFTFIDLFCGIGGFHIALSDLGGECVLASDIDKECQKVYTNNFGIEPVGDITLIQEGDIPDHDVLVGGFPCQPVSNAGKKKAFDDKRGKLFDEIVRIAKFKRPKIMILENVKHIKKVKECSVYDYIYDQLIGIGYNVQDIELSPHEFGIPQLRKRVYFICTDKEYYGDKKIIFHMQECIKKNIFQTREEVSNKYDLSDELKLVINTWDKIIKKMEVGQRISVPILLEEFHKEYDEDTFKSLADWKKNYIVKNKELYEKYKVDWDKWYEQNKELLTKKVIYSKLEWQTGPLKGNDTIWDYFIQLRQSGIRVKRSDNFPTLVAIVQVPIYGKQQRYLTPRECARLQSIPDDYILHETDKVAYKQLGNGVNSDVIRYLMESILKEVKL